MTQPHDSHASISDAMLASETVITLAEATRRLPRLGKKRISVSTIWRWAHHGVRGVRLEARRLGLRWVTSIEALDRFSKALAEQPIARAPAPRARQTTPRARAAAIERARAKLEAAGV